MTQEDLDKLAEEAFPGSSPDDWKRQVGFEAGFKKALELVINSGVIDDITSWLTVERLLEQLD